MDNLILERIKLECEKIEKEPGHGHVLIKIKNGYTYLIEPTPTIMLDNKKD